MKLDHKLRISFINVREHIESLEHELLLSRQLLVKQTEIMKLLSTKLDEIKENQAKISESSISQSSSDELLDNTILPSSIGNEGVKQSINQSITQHLSTNQAQNGEQSPKAEEFKDVLEGFFKHLSTSNQSLKHSDQAILSTFNPDFQDLERPKESKISAFKQELNDLFSGISQHELKVFLTLYQLEEEISDVSYTDLANKMKLTEACIRGYVSSLIKRNLPILRFKHNNRRTILRIKPDFKELNLKQKLISLYYKTDPFQTRLFDK